MDAQTATIGLLNGVTDRREDNPARIRGARNEWFRPHKNIIAPARAYAVFVDGEIEKADGGVPCAWTKLKDARASADRKRRYLESTWGDERTFEVKTRRVDPRDGIRCLKSSTKYRYTCRRFWRREVGGRPEWHYTDVSEG